MSGRSNAGLEVLMNGRAGAIFGQWFLRVIALLVWAGPAFGEPEGQAPQDVAPIVYDGARVYAPVGGASGPLGLFILDSGADDILIDDGPSRRAGARIVGEDRLHGAGRGEMTVGETGPVTLDIGRTPLRLDMAHVGALDALLFPYSGRHVAGLIGAPFFREHVVTIDFARRRLELRDPKTFAYRGDGVRLPIRFANDAPIIDGAITLPDGSRLKLRLLVDLGAEADLLIAEPFVAAHPALTRLRPRVVEPLGAGVGGETRYTFTRLPRLEAGPLSADDLVAGLSVGGALHGGYYDALLGARFLARYRVTFDYTHREIIFEPNPDAAPESFDRSGAFLVADRKDGQRLTIHFVAPGSPAAEAGLAPGDQVETLAGRPVSDDGLTEARRRLSGQEGETVPIRLNRGGRVIETILHLRPLL
jgi:hypothetical protein